MLLAICVSGPVHQIFDCCDRPLDAVDGTSVSVLVAALCAAILLIADARLDRARRLIREIAAVVSRPWFADLGHLLASLPKGRAPTPLRL
jgi:hypothetical protein